MPRTEAGGGYVFPPSRLTDVQGTAIRRILPVLDDAYIHSAGWQSGVRGWRLHADGSVEFKDLVIVSLSTVDDLTISVGGNARAMVGPSGLRTNYTANDLPRVWFRDTGSETSPSTTGSYVTIGSFNKAIAATHAVSIVAVAQMAFLQNSSTTGRAVRSRIRISIDGGSTWNNGSPARADDLRSDGVSRASVGPIYGRENVSPTGNVKVELQYQIDNTEVDIANSQLHVTIVGDF